jgi:hypothetical protein
VTDDAAVHLCQVCGQPIAVGEWPCIVTPRPHRRSVQTAPFASYFDVGLGREVTSLGDRWAAMKGVTTCDGEVVSERLEYRDKVSKGELAARRDRHEQTKRDRAR